MREEYIVVASSIRCVALIVDLTGSTSHLNRSIGAACQCIKSYNNNNNNNNLNHVLNRNGRGRRKESRTARCDTKKKERQGRLLRPFNWQSITDNHDHKAAQESVQIEAEARQRRPKRRSRSVDPISHWVVHSGWSDHGQNGLSRPSQCCWD
jgi:hypothetical protein